MAIRADMYYSIRSPYSYLAIKLLEQLLPQQDAKIVINLRPVLPIAARMPEIFKRANPMAIPYLEHDCRRAAEKLGIEFRIWPHPDPIVQNMETLEIAQGQPYVRPLTRRMQYACDQGKGYAYVLALATLLWDGNTDGWDQDDHLKSVAESVGLDYPAMERAIAEDAAIYDAAIAANQRSLAAAGHWGVPTIVYNGEPFFGHDRVETLLWRIAQKE
jgi:2-hydroxychromene-2-carboxylate isomerase